MLAKSLPHVTALVKTVVYWGAPNEAASAETKALGMTVYSFDDFLAMGRATPAEPIPPAASDLCTIMYTSGTTGDPKVCVCLFILFIYLKFYFTAYTAQTCSTSSSLSPFFHFAFFDVCTINVYRALN